MHLKKQPCTLGPVSTNTDVGAVSCIFSVISLNYAHENQTLPMPYVKRRSNVSGRFSSEPKVVRSGILSR